MGRRVEAQDGNDQVALIPPPVDEGTKRRVTDTPVHDSVKAAGSTHSSTRGLSSHEQLERQAEFHSSTQDEA